MAQIMKRKINNNMRGKLNERYLYVMYQKQICKLQPG